MNLQDKLDTFKADFKKKLPGYVFEEMAIGTNLLRASGIMDRVIRQGDALPPFTLPNQDGTLVSSADLLHRGPLVVSYFRGIWCPYCVIELQALRDAAADIQAAGAQLVVISPQLRRFATKTRADHDLPFDVLVDEGLRYADQLGTVFVLPEKLQEIYSSFGVDVPRHNGDSSWRLPMPTRLVVSQDGIVRSAGIDPDYTVRPDPRETLDVLAALNAAA